MFYVMTPEFNEFGFIEGFFAYAPSGRAKQFHTLVEADRVAVRKSGRVYDYEGNRMVKDHSEPAPLTPHEDRSVKQLRKDPKWVASQVFVHA
jgi:hypothetical protein